MLPAPPLITELLAVCQYSAPTNTSFSRLLPASPTKRAMDLTPTDSASASNTGFSGSDRFDITAEREGPGGDLALFLCGACCNRHPRSEAHVKASTRFRIEAFFADEQSVSG